MSQSPFSKIHIIIMPMIAIVNPAAFTLSSEEDCKKFAIFSSSFFGRIDHANPSITNTNANARRKVCVFTLKN